MSKLYIIAGPIGNLEDISYRAIKILASVDLILSEDTRTSLKLLNRYNIKNKLQSYHQHSNDKKLSNILDKLKEGNNIALLSEAGTPNISDPGANLISQIKENLNDEVEIIPVPGSCAVTTALSVSPWSADKYIFLGFLPHRKGRQSQIKKIIDYPYLIVLYESKHRLLKLLNELSLLEKESEKQIDIMIGREMTKKFEQFIFGRPEELIEKLNKNAKMLKGEFVLVLYVNKKNYGKK